MALLFLLILMPLSGSTQTSGENDEQQVMSVLDDFMTTFSNSDSAGHAATYHTPHFRLARGSMSNWATEEDVVFAHVRIFDRLSNTDWHHSEWVGEILLTSPTRKPTLQPVCGATGRMVLK